VILGRFIEKIAAWQLRANVLQYTYDEKRRSGYVQGILHD
jgi:hypothetical protein